MECVDRPASHPNTRAPIVNLKIKDYISSTNWMTKQERLVLQVVIALLLTGWAVKSYRTAHPPIASSTTIEEAKK